MNEHRKLNHAAVPLNKEEFLVLEKVSATKAGKKMSWVEVKHVAADDFRSESQLESRLGLLKSCVFFEGEEAEIENGSFFWNEQEQNPFLDPVIKLLERAQVLCSRAGSTLVRQHMKRDVDNKINATVFMPISLKKTLHCYAGTIAQFVYFCTKATWTNGLRHFSCAQDLLKQVLFEEHTSITQTFITRSVQSALHFAKQNNL